MSLREPSSPPHAALAAGPTATPVSGGAAVDGADVTALLIAWSEGDSSALDVLLPVVYAELRRQARRALRREAEGHTLQPTALVHEAYLKLVEQRPSRWQGRSQFYGVAARCMRQVLVDAARTRRAAKRGGGAQALRLSEAEEPVFTPAIGPVRADRDLIRRVLENLIDNAYKYGPRHTTISIEILPSTMDDGAEPAVEIRVRDEGEGVPASYRQLIFEKYGRVEGRSGATARGSHGLGLVFCRRAVGVHGGAIWVEDGAGRGGCFCVRLPAARLPLSAEAAPAVGTPRGGLAV